VLLQEFLLLLYGIIEIVKYEGQRVLVHNLSLAIGSEHLLHDLVKEIVREVSHRDSS
jgi:hypothetical protein